MREHLIFQSLFRLFREENMPSLKLRTNIFIKKFKGNKAKI